MFQKNHIVNLVTFNTKKKIKKINPLEKFIKRNSEIKIFISNFLFTNMEPCLKFTFFTNFYKI